MDDASGWLWLVVDVLFVAVFALALAYGASVYRRRRNTRAPEYDEPRR
jgi:hypothetical protein